MKFTSEGCIFLFLIFLVLPYDIKMFVPENSQSEIHRSYINMASA
jgi:hypothetical protein